MRNLHLRPQQQYHGTGGLKRDMGCSAGRVLTTLRALAEAGHLVSVEEERTLALADPGASNFF